MSTASGRLANAIGYIRADKPIPLDLFAALLDDGVDVQGLARITQVFTRHNTSTDERDE